MNEDNDEIVEFIKHSFDFEIIFDNIQYIYHNFVKKIEFELFQENFCKNTHFFKNTKNNVSDCDKFECKHGKISAFERAIVDTGFLLFKILNIINHRMLNLILRWKPRKINLVDVPKAAKAERIKEIMAYNQSNKYKQDCVIFFFHLLDQVELIYNNKVISLYFKMPYKCVFINDDIKNDVIKQEQINSHYQKFKRILSRIPLYIDTINQVQRFSKNRFSSFIYLHHETIEVIKYSFILLINFSLYFMLIYDTGESFEVSPKNTLIGKPYELIQSSNIYYLIYLILGLVVIGLSFVIFVFGILDTLPIVNFRIDFNKRNKNVARVKYRKIFRKYGSDFDINSTFEKKIIPKRLKKLYYLLTSGYNSFNFILVVLSITAIFQPIIWAVLLLELIKQSSDMQNIIKAITINKAQLIKTIILATIVMFIYSIIAFVYFPYNFNHSDNNSVKNYCNSLANCFSTIVYNGLRSGGGIGDVLDHLNITDNKYWLRFFFDLSFFVFIVVCLLNIIFGIIIDTFAALRDQKNEAEKFIHTKCFICEQDKFIIDSKGEGWDDHRDNSHNVTSYLNFLIYIDKKDVADCTGVEKYVKEQIQNNEYNFIPLGRSKYVEENNTE